MGGPPIAKSGVFFFGTQHGGGDMGPQNLTPEILSFVAPFRKLDLSWFPFDLELRLGPVGKNLRLRRPRELGDRAFPQRNSWPHLPAAMQRKY